nr:uncharacterized protein LOC128690929 isoform X1 [Cherax quadricarinatus]
MVMRLVPGVVVCVALLLLLTFVYPASPQHRNSACVDSSKECPAWATQGRCRTHPKFLQLVCPLSCNACVECGRGDVFKTSSRSTSTSRNTSRRRNSSRNKSSRRNTGNKSSSSSRGRRVRQIIFPDKLLELRAAAAAAASRNTIIFPDQLEALRAAAAAAKTVPTVDRPVDDSSPVTENSTAAVMVTDAFCGATVVSDRFLVTAAHCIFDLNHPYALNRFADEYTAPQLQQFTICSSSRENYSRRFESSKSFVKSLNTFVQDGPKHRPEFLSPSLNCWLLI